MNSILSSCADDCLLPADVTELLLATVDTDIHLDGLM